MKRVAAELGISANSLRNWRDKALGQGRAAQAVSAQSKGRSGAPLADPAGGDPPSPARERISAPPVRDLKKSSEHTFGRTAERYALIETMREQFSLNELCEALGVSGSGYYARQSRKPGPRFEQNQRLPGPMEAIHHHRHTRSYGSPRMTHELRGLGLFGRSRRPAHARRGDAGTAEKTFSTQDHQSRSRRSSFAQSPGRGRPTAEAGDPPGERHHLHPHPRRLALSRGSDRSL